MNFKQINMTMFLVMFGRTRFGILDKKLKFLAIENMWNVVSVP